jgi:hypothetical protein
VVRKIGGDQSSKMARYSGDIRVRIDRSWDACYVRSG